jgi:hypothetical protein
LESRHAELPRGSRFDKHAALVALGKHLGLFVEKRIVENPGLANAVRFVDGPPRETREQWIERRHRELAEMGKPPLPLD